MTPILLALVVMSQADAPDAGEAPAPVEAPPVAAAAPVAATPTAAAAADLDEAGPRAQENQPGAAGANPPTAILGEWWKKLRPFGYVKAGVFYTVPFTDEQLVGSNGGFRIATARFGFELALHEQLQVVASIEVGAPNLRPDDPLQGGRVVEARDAYVEYRPFRLLQFRIGQFKAPFNAETLLGDADLPFLTRSLATDGVSPPEAYGPRDGLTLGRQVGLMIFSDRLGGDAVGFRYFIAAVNGNGQNQLFNDSNPVAPVGRLELELFRKITIGVNGYYNVRTEGLRPNRLNTTQVGYGADLAARFGDFRALAGFLGRSNSYSGLPGFPSDMSMGAYAQAQYVLSSIGLEAGLRFAWIEPSTAQFQDRAWDYTAFLGYRFRWVPLRVILQYTHREEEQGVAIGNDSIDFMAQATW
ncbi:MAG: hypothetical protein JNK82_00785 [Myxococcaceae bacterium]|nr:hypothetical protein [Myxococcaceae bacterium]